MRIAKFSIDGEVAKRMAPNCFKGEAIKLWKIDAEQSQRERYASTANNTQVRSFSPSANKVQEANCTRRRRRAIPAGAILQLCASARGHII
jgi:hypothetical protein